jgi:hypothetical protein
MARELQCLSFPAPGSRIAISKNPPGREELLRAVQLTESSFNDTFCGMNRRELVQLLSGFAGAGAATTLAAGAYQAAAPAAAGAPLRHLPWPYKPLDPDAIAQRAFDSFSRGGCMYGAFEAIAGAAADQLGAPYKDFPFEMFVYGGGGIGGWGTACGTLNGAAAALQLLSPQPRPLVDALFAWYEETPLPDFSPKGAKFQEIRSAAGAPLCHAAIARWCKASRKGAYSPERAEWCGTLTASVARKAVLLLNDQAASKPVPFALPQATQTCLSCHGRGGKAENMLTKMNCGGCHAPLMGKHPAAK